MWVSEQIIPSLTTPTGNHSKARFQFQIFCMFNFDPFYKEHFPKIRDYARIHGLQIADCEDISQDILHGFWRKIQDGRANPNDQGVLKYLYKLAKWRIVDKARKNITHNKNYDQVGPENDLDELIKEESENQSWKREILWRATKQIKPLVTTKYYNCFVAQVFEDKHPKEMLNLYGVKIANAYLARHRVGQKVIAAAKELIKDGI